MTSTITQDLARNLAIDIKSVILDLSDPGPFTKTIYTVCSKETLETAFSQVGPILESYFSNSVPVKLLSYFVRNLYVYIDYTTNIVVEFSLYVGTDTNAKIQGTVENCPHLANVLRFFHRIWSCIETLDTRTQSSYDLSNGAKDYLFEMDSTTFHRLWKLVTGCENLNATQRYPLSSTIYIILTDSRTYDIYIGPSLPAGQRIVRIRKVIAGETLKTPPSKVAGSSSQSVWSDHPVILQVAQDTLKTLKRTHSTRGTKTFIEEVITLSNEDKAVVSEHLDDVSKAFVGLDDYPFDCLLKHRSTFVLFNYATNTITTFEYVFIGNALKIKCRFHVFAHLSECYGLLEYVNLLLEKHNNEKSRTICCSPGCITYLFCLDTTNLRKLWKCVTGLSSEITITRLLNKNILITDKDKKAMVEIGHSPIQGIIQVSFEKTSADVSLQEETTGSSNDNTSFKEKNPEPLHVEWCEQVIHTLIGGGDYDVTIEEILKLVVDQTIHIHTITPLRSNGDYLITRQRSILLGLVSILEIDTSNQDKLKKMTLFVLRELNTVE